MLDKKVPAILLPLSNYLKYQTMKYVLTLLTISVLLSCKPTENDTELLFEDMTTSSQDMFNELVEIRRDLHQYPELAGNEKRTATLVADYLKELQLEVHENIGGYGVVGILDTGKPGKKIAWRADIDALATEFEDDPVAFASKNPGLRHICGHDVHTTIALGIAKNLSLHKEQLVGTYYFVFQPAEETITGAKAMLEDGLLEVIQPDEFYALHMTPFPVGTVAVKPNEIYAHYKKIVLGLHTQDSSKINAATSYFKQLQNVTDERFGTDSSFEDATIGIVGSSSIYKNYTYLESPVKVQKLQDSTTLSAYISFSNAEELEQGRQKMDSLFKNGALQDVYKYHRIEPVSYVIKNHPETTKEAMQFLSNHYEDALTELSGSFPGGRSDDFALFQEEIPGTYFFMGASNFEQNIIAMPHTPIFQVDESVIEYGVRYFSTLLAARANYENIN